MNYHSTRNPSKSVTAAEAIAAGLSPDGGLFVPEALPHLAPEEIESLSGLSYNRRAHYILSRFLTGFSSEEIEECVSSAYNKKTFDTEAIAPVYKLKENEYILELWHGPTCAFKDMALQILPHLLIKSVEKTGGTRETVILVATSGDTGKAALEGFRDKKGTSIIVFYPDSGVSEIQRLQMVTQEGSNVNVCAVKGNFDDAQNGVKEIFTDKELEKQLLDNGMAFSSANSINWGRLVPQIVYYFSAYCDLLKNKEIQSGEQINIVVPTGNFGNILAAYYAKRMGLPVAKLICASNSNNVLTDFIRTGVYDKNRTFYTTVSPSMDILISSNLERFLYDVTDGDSQAINAYMNSLKETGKYDVGSENLEKISKILYAGCCSDEETVETIARVFGERGYLLDTHTAVAYKVYEEYVKAAGDSRKTVIASTASPYKFSFSVARAICEDVGTDEFKAIERISETSKTKVPEPLAQLRDKKARFSDKCEPSEMKRHVKRLLKIQ